MLLVLAADNSLLFLLAWEVHGHRRLFPDHHRAGTQPRPAAPVSSTWSRPTPAPWPCSPCSSCWPRHTGSLHFPAAASLTGRQRHPDLPPRPVRLRRQGRPDAAAHLAAGRPCRRAQPRLGAAVGDHAQDRHLRAAAADLLFRRDPALVGLDGAAARRDLRGVRRGAGPGPARSQTPARLPQRRKHRHHRHRPRPGPARTQLRHRRTGRCSGSAGALLHVVNHGLFKSLLFFSAGSVVHATGSREIDHYGGLLRRQPWTGRLLPRRCGGDLRSAAAQRLRQRMADLPRGVRRPPGAKAWPCAWRCWPPRSWR